MTFSCLVKLTLMLSDSGLRQNTDRNWTILLKFFLRFKMLLSLSLKGNVTVTFRTFGSKRNLCPRFKSYYANQCWLTFKHFRFVYFNVFFKSLYTKCTPTYSHISKCTIQTNFTFINFWGPYLLHHTETGSTPSGHLSHLFCLFHKGVNRRVVFVVQIDGWMSETRLTLPPFVIRWSCCLNFHLCSLTKTPKCDPSGFHTKCFFLGYKGRHTKT